MSTQDKVNISYFGLSCLFIHPFSRRTFSAEVLSETFSGVTQAWWHSGTVSSGTIEIQTFSVSAHVLRSLGLFKVLFLTLNCITC